VSPLLDSLAVCLGAISALRAAFCIDETFRQPILTNTLRHLPWQSHALNLIAGLGTVIYAFAGGSREVLVASVLILCAGASVPLIAASRKEAQP